MLTACRPYDSAFFESQRAELRLQKWEELVGGEVDPNQKWVTAVTVNAQVSTPVEGYVSVYSVGQETRELYARFKVSGKRDVVLNIPQNESKVIAMVFDNGSSKSYKCLHLTDDLKQQASIDFSDDTNVTRATCLTNETPQNSVSNPNQKIMGSGIVDNYGYYNYPGWIWDNIAKAVPERADPKSKGQTVDYDLISNGPFYLSLLYGYTGDPSKHVIGYYYHSEGTYDDFTMVDLTECHVNDYIDGFAKVQFRLDGESKWYDCNFDYIDFPGSNAKNVNRRGDEAYNTLKMNEKYKGGVANGGKIAAVRGLTYQINVPVGKRMGFYLRADEVISKGVNAAQAQYEMLVAKGISPKLLANGKFPNTTFSDANLNYNHGGKTYYSVIKRYDDFIFMGLDDNAYEGDHDSNDVTFGLVSGNGGSLPGIILPGVYDNVKKQYYNTDNTFTTEPEDFVYGVNNQGKLPEGVTKNEVKEFFTELGASTEGFPEVSKPTEIEGGTENPGGEIITEPVTKDESMLGVELATWTIAYEDAGVEGDFDFNDVVIHVRPRADGLCNVYACAAGGSKTSVVYFEDENGNHHRLGEIHELLNGTYGILNTDPNATFAYTYAATVRVPLNESINEVAHRFYIKVEDKDTQIVKTNTQSGQAPLAVVIKGEWQWPQEGISIMDAYPTIGEWAKDYTKGQDWYELKNAVKTKITTPKSNGK